MIRTKTIPWTSRLRRNKSEWPDPEASIGTFYRKMGRDSSCWEAVGPARETFIRIADEIKNHLEKASESVPQAVTWTMYMIGKTKDTAEPMIVFCCRESASRKQVRKTVEESGIFQRYPGIRVGDASRPLDFDQLVQLAGKSSGPVNVGQNANTKKLEFRCEANGRLYANRDHLGYDLESVMGNRMFVKLPGKDATIRKATIGGIVQSGSREFYLTAGHAFESSPSEASDNVKDDFDCDIGEESEIEAEQDFIDSTSRGSLSPERADYSSSDEFSTPMGTESDISPNSTGKSFSRVPLGESNCNTDTADSGTGSVLPRRDTFENREVYMGNILHPRLNQNRPTLDYALIEITKPSFLEYGHNILRSGSISLNLALSTTIESVSHNTKIIAITSSGRNLEGIISGTPTYNTAESNKVHEFWTIKLNGRLEDGDCGSWVVSAGGGVFYGHIVAGSPESGAAYVVPAYEIFRDAKRRFGVDLRFPTKKPLELQTGTQAQVTNRVTSASSNASASLDHISPLPSALRLWEHENSRSTVYAEQVLEKGESIVIVESPPNPRATPQIFTPPSSTNTRLVHTQAEWLELKHVIQRLYIEEGLAFRQVAAYLERNFGFKTTKMQFSRRVKAWGFEKNIKREERKMILQTIGDGVLEGEFEAKVFRGRRLDKAKIGWRKRDGLVGHGSRNEIAETSSISGQASGISVKGALDDSGSIGKVNFSPFSQIQVCNEDEAVEEKIQIFSGGVELQMARPVLVDERPLYRARSIEDMSDRPRRPRSSSRTRMEWDSPSSPHASFDEHARREVEETEARERNRERRRDERIALVEAERWRNEITRQQNEEIRRRPAVSLPSAPLIRTRSGDRSQDLKGKMIGLSVSDESSRGGEVEEWSPREEREREQTRRDRLRDEEEEAMRQRMRERQIPKRRSSVGHGNTRQRVLYDDGVYGWE
ncbi:hypothetical protein V8E51_013733 [Hyaloscypha variabilis]